MTHTPLGEVCLALGLMSTQAIEDVLARLRVSGRARFGEIAIELGFITDEGLSRALAHQFRLNMVPPDRLARLSVAPEVIELLPSGLIRDRLLVPTFLDEEKRVLSLLTADPTDVPSLRAAQTAARAARLRLFVAPRNAMRELVDRLLPPDEEGARASPRLVSLEDQSLRGRTVVYEPDAERASALRRLDVIEGGASEIVGDPEQVSAFMEANQVDRLFLRRAVLVEVEPYLPAWRRHRPLVNVCVLDGFGPSKRVAIPYDRTRDFFMEAIASALTGVAGAAWRDTIDLARSMAEEAGLPGEQRDTVALTALMWGLGTGDSDEVKGLERAEAMLTQFAPPYDVVGLVAALLPRVAGEAGPGPHIGAELLYTARAAIRADLPAEQDPVLSLGSDAARHDGVALSALSAVLRRKGLQQRVQAPAPPPQDAPPQEGPSDDPVTEGGSILGSLRRALGRPPPPAVAGRLSDLSITDLLQTLTVAQKTARVVILGSAERGLVQVREGRLEGAMHGARVGEAALQTLLLVRDGRFEVRFDDEGLANLGPSAETLLGDAVRRRDDLRPR